MCTCTVEAGKSDWELLGRRVCGELGSHSSERLVRKATAVCSCSDPRVILSCLNLAGELGLAALPVTEY